ncbi:MAG: dephospho-CoA kinase [Gemmataceae bacterium]
MTLVIGLLGGIGSGKSAAAEEFARRGARVINADALGHEALVQPAIRDAIVARWGEGVLDEQRRVDRRRLAAVVFREEGARRELEALTHPFIRRRAEEEVARARRDQIPLVVIDAAVMLEAGWNDVCDRLVFVEASPEARLARVTGGRGWNRADWEARERAQLPLTQKYARADHVLDNSSTLDHLSRQIDDLMRRWGLSPRRPLAVAQAALLAPPPPVKERLLVPRRRPPTRDASFTV